MKLHTDKLTYADLVAATQAHGMYGISFIQCHMAGSRRRKHAWIVSLAGSSPYRAQADRESQAATWDEWGIFLAELFRRDPMMFTDAYPSAEYFEFATDGRFNDLEYVKQHRRHKWEPTMGLPGGYEGECTGCDAVHRADWDRRREEAKAA